ncbi:MAG: YHS domain-containing (seleno)protein, partial [Pseudomonadota bacterium]
VLLFSLSGIALAQTPPPEGVMMKKEMGNILDAEHDPAVCAPAGVAIGGYDLVSYHQEDGPKMGVEAFSATVGELTYLFQNEANQKTFEKNPDAYLPQYSGWCAISLALGRLTCPDYNNFQIENGQLLLFETTGFTNGRVVWNADRVGNRQKADNNYVVITEQE